MKETGSSLPSLGDWKRRDGTTNDSAAPSDGYATRFWSSSICQAGVPASDSAVRRGVAWLLSNQRASGRWFTRCSITEQFSTLLRTPERVRRSRSRPATFRKKRRRNASRSEGKSYPGVTPAHPQARRGGATARVQRSLAARAVRFLSRQRREPGRGRRDRDRKADRPFGNALEGVAHFHPLGGKRRIGREIGRRVSVADPAGRGIEHDLANRCSGPRHRGPLEDRQVLVAQPALPFPTCTLSDALARADRLLGKRRHHHTGQTHAGTRFPRVRT